MAPTHPQPASAPTPRSNSAADPQNRDALPGPFYVDTHVHIYPTFDPPTVLDAAVRNVAKHHHAIHPHDEPHALAVLLLTECRGDHVFKTWQREPACGPWQFTPGPNPAPDQAPNPVLFGQRDGSSHAVAIVAGRQIITQPRIELLALGLAPDIDIPDGQDLEQTIAQVRGQHALPVLPYGFGKWTGKRGAAVSRLIEAQAQSKPTTLVLGDNGGRPTLGPRPPHFDQAAAHHLTLLPGTDPLPLRSCQKQAGRFGVRLTEPIAPNAFVPQLLQQLQNLGPVPPRFGDHVSLLRAAYQQLALRLDRKCLGAQGRL